MKIEYVKIVTNNHDLNNPKLVCLSDMNKICLFALLVAVASANLGADISNLASSRQTLNCLASQNMSRVTFEISDERGAINKDFLNGYIFARDAGIATVDAIVIVNDNFTSTSLSANVTSALPASFNGTIWLRVLASDQLWNQDVSKRISYLETLVLAFKQRGVKAGVYSDANAWAAVFGTPYAGSDTLKAVPVWYANDNGVQNFDDFDYAGFGTWTQPSLKSYQKYAYLCYTTITSLNFYKV